LAQRRLRAENVAEVFAESRSARPFAEVRRKFAGQEVHRRRNRSTIGGWHSLTTKTASLAVSTRAMICCTLSYPMTCVNWTPKSRPTVVS
jgi:hypothetical protein